jgi:siroheme synthase
MLFGRAQEEIAALEANGIRCEVVPGITAALAAAAELRTSLTQRGVARSVTFATPRVGTGEAQSDWANGLKVSDAGAIYMGVGEAAAIAATLLAAGKPRSLPVAVVENASLPDQIIRYTTLENLPRLAADALAGPAVILLGPQFAARSMPRRVESGGGLGFSSNQIARRRPKKPRTRLFLAHIYTPKFAFIILL